MIVEFGGSALVVTHDRWFLDRVATVILNFEDDGRVVRYAGNHESYRQQKAAAEEARSAAKSTATKRASTPPPKPVAAPIKGKPLTYGERLELDGILDRIDEAERAVVAIEAALAKPALYAGRGAEVATATQKLDRAKAEVARLVSRWEDLERKKNGLAPQ